MARLVVAIAAFAMLAGCGEPEAAASDSDVPVAEIAPAGSGTVTPIAPLPELFDCLRTQGGVVVAAHRGGFAPGYPENALETLQHGLDQGVRVFEIDVASSRDGVLFLHHDDRFGRTADAEGYVADTDWADIAGFRLKDSEGKRTAFHPVKLTDALLWAKQRGAILELDRKQTTGFRNIIEAVRAAGAEGNVILISYSDEEAGAIAKLDPALMMTASARGSRDIEKLEALGVDRTRIIAWTGTSEPDPAAFERLVKEGVEPAFGTLGRKGERLDDQYWADGDGSEYQRLVDDGVVLIATDEPYRVAAWLDADDAGWAACAAR
ncbi:MAG: glycerophosphodiester phosphodiesterase family protein [Hyphomonas sp.]|nr:glycerophosphodiester phosphodiesterase family protein [Hyphomonas sp.]